MANNTAGNPFVIDTPTACGLYTGRFRLYNIYWASATAADTLVVQDGAGTQRFSCLGTQPPYAPGGDDGVVFNGLIIPTLTAGTVYLTVERT